MAGLHIELLANDWAGARQIVLARVDADDLGVLVRTTSKVWLERLLSPIAVRGEESVRPEDGEAFLDALHEKFQGTYQEANAPHTEAECLFQGRNELPMIVTAAD